MAALELILVRHGETDWNEGLIFRGLSDVRLNATGIAQADLVAERLKGKVLDAIYTSPLKRALVTARRVAMPHEMDVREKSEFMDLNFGLWTGRKESEVKENWPSLYKKWVNTPGRVKPPAERA